MKWREGPSSSDANDTSETCTSRSTGAPSPSNTRTCSRVTSAVSPSSRKITRRVAWRIAETSEAMKFRSEEHTSELQSLMRISYAVFCLKKKITQNENHRSV